VLFRLCNTNLAKGKDTTARLTNWSMQDGKFAGKSRLKQTPKAGLRIEWRLD